jgi:hypothetical protein
VRASKLRSHAADRRDDRASPQRLRRGAIQGGVIIKIAISVEAFEAIARTLALGSVAVSVDFIGR